MDDRTRTAYHEAGHAVVAAYVPGALGPRGVSIVPDGATLGRCHYPQPFSVHLAPHGRTGAEVRDRVDDIVVMITLAGALAERRALERSGGSSTDRVDLSDPALVAEAVERIEAAGRVASGSAARSRPTSGRWTGSCMATGPRWPRWPATGSGNASWTASACSRSPRGRGESRRGGRARGAVPRGQQL
jgi:hypothetical protein